MPTNCVSGYGGMDFMAKYDVEGNEITSAYATSGELAEVEQYANTDLYYVTYDQALDTWSYPSYAEVSASIENKKDPILRVHSPAGITEMYIYQNNKYGSNNYYSFANIQTDEISYIHILDDNTVSGNSIKLDRFSKKVVAGSTTVQSGSTATLTSAITVPSDGTYLVSVDAAVEAATSSSTVYNILYRLMDSNSTYYGMHTEYGVDASLSHTKSNTWTNVVTLPAGDYVLTATLMSSAPDTDILVPAFAIVEI